MQQERLLTRTAAILGEIVGRFSLGSLGMYALTLASELPVILARSWLVYTLACVALAIEGHSTAYATVWFEVGLIPPLLSIVALATPFGTGWWWKQRTGGRRPSQREQLAYRDATELLQAQTRESLTLPRNWFVLDTPTPDAAVCGQTLMLSRGLLESDHLPAVLAHELGHLATPDGRLTAAINRLVLLPPQPSRQEQAGYVHQDTGAPVELAFRSERILLTILGIRLILWIIEKTLKFVNGGFGLRLVGPVLGTYWRGREYKADAYAAILGQAEDLADFLENHVLIHDHPIPYIWLTEHTHPPTELRIDKLRDAEMRGPEASLNRSQPM
jgi:Zn-dependent protease with chaperone function